MSDYQKYEIQAGDLSEAQLDIICNFDIASGVRASKKDTYETVTVGFNKGKCFHVAFKC